jgi:hypothetical protein
MPTIRASHKIDKDFAPFTFAKILDSITAAKNSNATGPDGLTSVHLKHLGPHGLEYLTMLFNLSVGSADLPSIWKAAVIVSVLKPGKPANEGSSYRPISLLCPAAKVLEWLLLPAVTDALPKDASQHGFSPLHSCTTALLPIVTRVAIGFNNPKPARRTAMYAIDISKAFDAIDHTLLLELIAASPLHSNFVRWLACYISSRTTCCLYNSALSSPCIICTGVLQGSVLSPTLFNAFVADCPHCGDILESYADDFDLVESNYDLASLSGKLQSSIDPVVVWACLEKLSIAPAKSQVTLFTPFTKQVNDRPAVTTDGVDIPLCRTPKILGVTFDTLFCFRNHVF